MNLKITLSEESIRNAINELQDAKQNLQWGIEETLDILARDGADIAQVAYGHMGYVVGYLDSDDTAVIQASGEAVLIAEFGAGDATELPLSLYENAPETEVYPGSYSELVGSGEYAATGAWHFGGKRYTEVQPRLGLYKALEHITQESTNVAQGVIKL